MGKFTRRAALGLLGLTGIGAAGYGASLTACRFVPRNKADFFALIDVVPDDAAARRIGTVALRQAAVPADLAALGERLLERPLLRQAMASDCPVSRRALVQEQCGADFGEGRTVMVDGWLLSETEVGLCAARRLADAMA